MERKEQNYFHIEDYLIDLNKFEQVKIVSRSAYSTCILVKDKQNSKQYIVKTFIRFDFGDDTNSKQSKKKIINDFIFNLSQLDHLTIIKFHGFSYKDFDGEYNISIVLDYAENGSLSTLISNCRKALSPLEYNNTLCQIILLGIARSMMLISKYKKFSGNLRPENVLFDQNFHPLLTNFCYLNYNEIGNSIYDAPEVLAGRRFSEKSDVYSFGIIMYELITFQEPFSELSNKITTKFFTSIAQGYRPQFKVPINQNLKELIERCWSSKIDERPSFEELFYKLAYDKQNYLEGTKRDDVMSYIEMIKSDLIFCTICHKKVNKEDLIYYSGSSYHKNCVECSVCHKKLNTIEDEKEFICVASDLFFCQQHFEEIENPAIFPKEKHDEYQDKMIKGIINDAFDSNDFNNDQILDNKPDDIFIDSEMIQNSFQIDKQYKYIIPTITVHYNSDAKNIDINKLQELLLPTNLIIFGAKKGSLILKIAYVASNASQDLNENHHKIISSIKNKLESSIIDKPVCSNLIEVKYSIPNDEMIKKFFKKKAFNHLQNFDFLDKIKIKEIENYVCNKLKEENNKKDWEFLLNHQKLFKKIEKQVREDIKNNKIEMIIIGQTVIANKYFEEYENIKSKLKENACERILYHGSRLANHYGIVSENFKEPDEIDEQNKHDDGFFGKGIYATNNLFYSTYFADYRASNNKGCRHLKENGKASIICCKAVYNKQYVKEINKRIDNQEIEQEIYSEYGINHAFTGNSDLYKKALSKEESEKEIVGSEEFVFPHKFQIIPVCSFKIKRTEYLILWKDENIYNEENTKYWKYFKHNLEANVYLTTSNEEALKIIELKRFNKIKFITNGGENSSGKQLIIEARKIMKSNFICLVFANEEKHLEWIVELENVIFTNRPPIFDEFVELNMKDNLILDFIKKREEEYKIKFKINENTLFKFPNYFNLN